MPLVNVQPEGTPALPIGPSDVLVDFPPGRNPNLPTIYIMVNHPLQVGSGNAYYYLYEGTFEAAERIYNLEVNELKIPQGSYEEAISLGFMEMRPGDIMFSRPKTGSVTGHDDVPVLWVTGGDLYDSDTKLAALRARDCALGGRSLRSRSYPHPDPLNPKIKKGGTAWERSLVGKFDHKRGCCYPFGCTFQKQRALYSPCAAGKLTVADEETLKMRKDLTQVTLDMAMLSFKQGPRTAIEAIRLNHDLINTPCVGTEHNYAFTSNQINIAHVREWDSCQQWFPELLYRNSFSYLFSIAETLADNMGIKFGGAHIDQLDSPGHFTNMISLSDLPKECDPGRFFIVYPGIFCTLDNFVSVNFSGLRVHGGSPPIASKDATEYEKTWGTRCTVVAYSKTGPTSTEHKMPLLQLEPNVILSITPEMLRPEPFTLDKKSKADATNFIVEGPTLMSSAAVMDFLARCFLILVLTMLSQLPSRLNIKVDADAFLGSFYYNDEDGNARRVAKWEDGPGWRNSVSNHEATSECDLEERFRMLKDQGDHLDTKRGYWDEYQNRYGAHIPSVLCCHPDITPLDSWTPGDPLRKIKLLTFNKGNKESANNVSTGSK